MGEKAVGMHPVLSASAKGERGEQREQHSDFINRFSCTRSVCPQEPRTENLSPWASCRKCADQLKGFLIILEIFCIVYLDYLGVFTKANELPYLMCDASRFLAVPRSIHPSHLSWQCGWVRSLLNPRESCWIQKKYKIRTIRINWDPWIQQLEDFVLLSSPGQSYIFSAIIWPGSHQALVALQQHHTRNGWPWSDAVSCLGARKRVDLTLGFCSFDT